MKQTKLCEFSGIPESNRRNIINRFRYSILLSAVGDCLGWPLEFSKKKPKERLEHFIRWKKIVGGKWWGYEDEILPGEYSDDTQLILAVARSIDSSGNFNPEYFAYLELPLWLNYERGGGKSMKIAARNILKKRVKWFSNFYKIDGISYFNAGANGAAMRNLPIALVNINNERRFIIDTFKNALITHGHPRAIVGSILIGSAQIFLLKEESVDYRELYEYIHLMLKNTLSIVKENDELNRWIRLWSEHTKQNFEDKFKEYVSETITFIRKIPDYLSKDDIEYYKITKALDPLFKGSGTTTTAVAIYMFLKYSEHPDEALIRAANFVGSDTDTIAGFVGSLIGCLYGKSIPTKLKRLASQIQDKNYLESLAGFLWDVSQNELNIVESEQKIDKRRAYLKILAWEIGLHELFWDALDEGDRIIHPTLGRGTIEYKTIRKIPQREDYIAKIFKIKFDSGQTAYFHSRVSKEGVVTERLSKFFENAL